MINSAEEFIALRDSEKKEEYDRSAQEEAPNHVWIDIINRFPEYQKWVAHNKTVPLEILEELCKHGPETRQFVATKRKLSKELFYLLANDAESTVRQAIAANKKAPIDILNFLINDDDEDVASVAKYNIQNR
ncbi:hypothetical protein [Chromobacterium haemolyticum]|uniref:hypothetical protein n=1 Tax=Chromobacterium haemolyticum TaxID=394935 RepID=UPI0009D9156B|nr:hypothetical protein [Chromobacterium haemolyticum]OQS36489.1 hypothetical protein B0T39_16645 [Chromobacterium haemolyticum]